ncbi:hypothetical protein [uncultured Paenibacillus sp.]|uniref:hypothetical protein n=1 Tax=uncultured Paenibacillus sp. TaxID=227322 RepID=UPI0015AA7BE9|nr:hypothetical protein [uncultured Paenibacillus sp.]
MAKPDEISFRDAAFLWDSDFIYDEGFEVSRILERASTVDTPAVYAYTHVAPAALALIYEVAEVDPELYSEILKLLLKSFAVCKEDFKTRYADCVSTEDNVIPFPVGGRRGIKEILIEN